MADFRYKDLADDGDGRLVRLVVDGEAYLMIRRPLPIPRVGVTFQTHILDAPRTATQIAMDIYDTIAPWALLMEWNGLAEPGRYLKQPLPTGFVVRYLALDTYRAMVQRRRIPTLFGAGDIEGEV